MVKPSRYFCLDRVRDGAATNLPMEWRGREDAEENDGERNRNSRSVRLENMEAGEVSLSGVLENGSLGNGILQSRTARRSTQSQSHRVTPLTEEDLMPPSLIQDTSLSGANDEMARYNSTSAAESASARQHAWTRSQHQHRHDTDEHRNCEYDIYSVDINGMLYERRSRRNSEAAHLPVDAMHLLHPHVTPTRYPNGEHAAGHITNFENGSFDDSAGRFSSQDAEFRSARSGPECLHCRSGIDTSSECQCGGGDDGNVLKISNLQR